MIVSIRRIVPCKSIFSQTKIHLLLCANYSHLHSFLPPKSETRPPLFQPSPNPIRRISSNMNDKGEQYADEHQNGLGLQRTNTFLSMTPEMFEKLYLSPPSKAKGQLRQTFGNPTPIAVLGFCVALTPLSVELMGWRGAGGSTATAYVLASVNNCEGN